MQRSSNPSAPGSRQGRGTALLLLSILVAMPAAARAEETIAVGVPIKGAQVVRFRQVIDDVAVADPRIADVKVLGRKTLQVIGKRVGETVIMVTDKEGATTQVMASVGLPTAGLANKLRQMFPGESIVPRSVGDMVILTGSVSDPMIVEQAAKIAGAYLSISEKKILNYLQVGGRQQVQLRVKIAEVARDAMRQMGTNIWQRGEKYSGGLLAPGIALGSEVAPSVPGEMQAGGGLGTGEGQPAHEGALPLIAGPLTGSGFGIHLATAGVLPLSIAISLLQQRGMAKVLSEPTLVAYSGSDATFLAGGEFPYPIPQGLGQVAIEFKKFGVQLQFTPTVLASDTIHLKVTVSVSERDPTNSLILAGATVPALNTRHGETTVRMRDGESFAIAGLLQNRIASSRAQIPLLGDIPILGMFFRRNTFERQERELVILVTPYLVRPLRPGEVPPLPGEDEVADPGSAAFFLLGTVDPELEVKEKRLHRRKPRPRRRSRPAGPVGYSQ